MNLCCLLFPDNSRQASSQLIWGKYSVLCWLDFAFNISSSLWTRKWLDIFQHSAVINAEISTFRSFWPFYFFPHKLLQTHCNPAVTPLNILLTLKPNAAWETWHHNIHWCRNSLCFSIRKDYWISYKSGNYLWQSDLLTEAATSGSTLKSQWKVFYSDKSSFGWNVTHIWELFLHISFPRNNK